VFEYEIKGCDGVGTSYDALHVAVSAMEDKLAQADSNDDLADVFKEIEYI
jgi:hypothetical protein